MGLEGSRGVQGKGGGSAGKGGRGGSKGYNPSDSSPAPFTLNDDVYDNNDDFALEVYYKCL